MKYVCLVYPAEELPPTRAEAEAFFAFRDAAQEAGVFISSGRLLPSDSATTVRRRGEEMVLTDGPFAEMKEHVGGFVLLDCADLDDALKWVARIPVVSDAAVEVRPMLEMGS